MTRRWEPSVWLIHFGCKVVIAEKLTSESEEWTMVGFSAASAWGPDPLWNGEGRMRLTLPCSNTTALSQCMVAYKLPAS